MKLYALPLSLKEEIRILTKTTSRVVCSAPTLYVFFVIVYSRGTDSRMVYDVGWGTESRSGKAVYFYLLCSFLVRNIS